MFGRTFTGQWRGCCLTASIASTTRPVISAWTGTTNGWDSAVLRLTNLASDGSQATADFLVQEDQSLDDEVLHKPEDVYGIAFAEDSLLFGTSTSSAMILSDGMEIA